MYGVGIIYNEGGWLSADGKLLLRESHRAAYLTRLTERGAVLPVWAQAYMPAGSSSGSSSTGVKRGRPPTTSRATSSDMEERDGRRVKAKPVQQLLTGYFSVPK
jgi:hypothetical protein